LIKSKGAICNNLQLADGKGKRFASLCGFLINLKEAIVFNAP
jgi:hypothetical protein